MSAATGWGAIARDGSLLPWCGIKRVSAMRAAIWYSAAKPGVGCHTLLPLGSDEPLNAVEVESWRWLYRRGVRVVRVRLSVESAKP